MTPPCWEVSEKGEDEADGGKDGGVEDEIGERSQPENGSDGYEEHEEVSFFLRLNSTRNKHLTITVNGFGFSSRS